MIRGLGIGFMVPSTSTLLNEGAGIAGGEGGEADRIIGGPEAAAVVVITSFTDDSTIVFELTLEL